MFCNKNQFPSFPFCVPDTKPHGVRGLIKQYHMVMLTQTSETICFFVWGKKLAMMEIGLYYKNNLNISVQHQHPPEHDIPFLSTFVFLAFFVFALINYNMFACRIRQVFLKFSGQSSIRCTGYSVHNYLCVVNFLTRKLHS